jgi:hypothetical protein
MPKLGRRERSSAAAKRIPIHTPPLRRAVFAGSRGIEVMNEKKNGTVVITEWKQNKREVGRLTIEEFDGREIVHLRVWALDKQGAPVPTKRGITIPPDQLARTRKGLRKVEKDLVGGPDTVSPSIKRKWPPK